MLLYAITSFTFTGPTLTYAGIISFNSLCRYYVVVIVSLRAPLVVVNVDCYVYDSAGCI